MLQPRPEHVQARLRAGCPAAGPRHLLQLLPAGVRDTDITTQDEPEALLLEHISSAGFHLYTGPRNSAHGQSWQML